jgi:UDP-N-acetylglucosamine 1-carboxyvinyltransferase
MSNFEIIGGKSLSGTIIPQGSKNEALQIIAACLLTSDKIELKNVPEITDVLNLIKLLKVLGVNVTRKKTNHFIFQAKKIDKNYFKKESFKKLSSKIRGSIMIMGPLVSRQGQAHVLTPGGDKIGRRPLDTHFKGLESLGAEIKIKKDNIYQVLGKRLTGKKILLEEASVTATANIIMAATLATGTTEIYNAACEPYIQQLCKMLNSMGGKISGIGTNLIKVEGVSNLHGTSHKILPDMIEIGSWIGLAVMTQSSLTIKNCSINNLGIILTVFKKLGVKLKIQNDDIVIKKQKTHEIDTFMNGSILTISDAPWPGFTPDLISIILVLATQAKGSVLIHQKMFESRLFFVDKLIDMGAKIILCDPHRATVVGINRKYSLKGTNMSSPDIRAGIALLIAALSAKGKSIIYNINQIDRGYENIVERLQKIGANIKRN